MKIKNVITKAVKIEDDGGGAMRLVTAVDDGNKAMS